MKQSALISFALPLVASALVFSLTACGPIHNRSTEYVQAENGPALELPKEMSNKKVNNYYPIPKTTTTGKKVVAADLTPPGLIGAQDEAEQAKKTKKQGNTQKTTESTEPEEPADADADADTDTDSSSNSED